MSSQYKPLDPNWQNDDSIKCCKENPSDGGGGCDCCYDSWVTELSAVRQKYGIASEKARQLNDEWILSAAQRDKLKAWLDDLVGARQLSMAVCDQFSVMASQAEKICTNTEKTTEAIRILFCMIRDFFNKTDGIIDSYNYIDNCIKCIGNDLLPEGSGIRKCLKLYKDKVDALQKLTKDLIKAVMTAVSTSNGLHAGICSDYGLRYVITEWTCKLGCDEKPCTPTAVGPCDPVTDKPDPNDPCKLLPILKLPLGNDPYFKWVQDQYDADVKATDELGAKLLAANKEKEALSACQTSLEQAIKEVDPKELCK